VRVNRAELALDEAGSCPVGARCGRREEGFQVLVDHLVQAVSTAARGT
jgi:hypothetical protein